MPDRCEPELPGAELTVIEHRNEIEFRAPDGSGSIRADSDDVLDVGRVGDD
jgi:hypothetical protein